MSYLLALADCRRGIPLADRSVHCCVTSPPYYQQRDYGTSGQIGLEPTPDCGKRHLFRLRSDLTEAQREYVVRRLLASGLLGGGICGSADRA